MNKSSSYKMSPSGFWITCGAALIGVACYYADRVNLPVLAPALDWITGYLYARSPMLRSLPYEGWFATSGAVGGLGRVHN